MPPSRVGSAVGFTRALSWRWFCALYQDNDATTTIIITTRTTSTTINISIATTTMQDQLKDSSRAEMAFTCFHFPARGWTLPISRTGLPNARASWCPDFDSEAGSEADPNSDPAAPAPHFRAFELTKGSAGAYTPSTLSEFDILMPAL